MSNKSDTAGVIAPPPLLAAGALVLGIAMDFIAPAYILAVLFSFETRLTLGLLLILFSLLLAVPAFLALRRAGTTIEPWQPTTVLVRDGPYRYVRNPIYIGFILLLIGTGLILASDWTLVLTVAFALVIHLGVVKREEVYLQAKFGADYLNYRAAVSRYGWPRL